MATSPPVTLLESIQPNADSLQAEALAYEGLGQAASRYAQDYDNWDTRFWQQEELLQSAAKLAEVDDIPTRNEWADRYTQASEELYGQPDITEVHRLLSNEYAQLMNLKGRDGVSQDQVALLLETYRPVVSNTEVATSAETAKERQIIAEYGAAIKEQYGPLFELAAASGHDEFTPQQLADLFTDAFSWLRQHDGAGWEGWKVVLDPNAAAISPHAIAKVLKVPAVREPASLAEAQGLVAHELLVHVLRGKNGAKLSDKTFAEGLPGYLESEEGLGILAEQAITGALPDKAYDRYVDIGLALGMAGEQKTRQELFKISFARQLVRMQLRGTYDESMRGSLERKVWRHVARIYRGGPGDSLDAHQAIFTRDIAYYAGYKKMLAYIIAERTSGKSAAEIFNYISSAKFDPTNPQHVARLAAAQS